jgi:FlaA1/EpsC-like NDP-sugar epimerase
MASNENNISQKSIEKSKKINEYRAQRSKLKCIGVTLIPWLYWVFIYSQFYGLANTFFNILWGLFGGFGLWIYLRIVVFRKSYELSALQEFIINYSSKVFYTGIVIAISSLVWLMITIPNDEIGLLGFFVIAVFLAPLLIVFYRIYMRHYIEAHNIKENKKNKTH